MPPLTITATFPLGVFQGHRADGSADPLPDTARLFSALVNAASQGTDAFAVKGKLGPSSESTAALAWLEQHPPTMIKVPNHVPVQSGRYPTTFREEGTIGGAKSSPAPKKRSAAISTGTALASSIGWIWKDAPSTVQECIGRLCADVSCLGEADSPVVLTMDEFTPTHELVASTQQLRPTGLAMRTPGPGRLDELIQAHAEAHPAKRPSEATDRPSLSQLPHGSRVATRGLQVLRYRSPHAAPGKSPWPRAMLLALQSPIRSTDSLMWCVSLHRMLVAMLDQGAPAIVTGHYTRGAAVPPNRVSIQYLPPSLLAHLPQRQNFPHGALAVLLPDDMSAEDLQAVRWALNMPTRRLWSRAGEVFLDAPLTINASTFWPEPRAGWATRWRTLVGMVPETRRQHDHAEFGRWGLTESALLSVGHVFKQELKIPSSANYWDVVRTVREHGVEVINTHLIADSHVSRFVHRTPPSIGVVQPYTAELDLASLVGPRALLALGQARHLGGGLLVPTETPEAS